MIGESQRERRVDGGGVGSTDRGNGTAPPTKPQAEPRGLAPQLTCLIPITKIVTMQRITPIYPVEEAKSIVNS